MALTQTGENQRKIGVNLSKIIGLKDMPEKMKPLDMERQKGGYNAVGYNANGQPCGCGNGDPNGGGGSGGGGSGGGGSGGGGDTPPVVLPCADDDCVTLSQAAAMYSTGEIPCCISDAKDCETGENIPICLSNGCGGGYGKDCNPPPHGDCGTFLVSSYGCGYGTPPPDTVCNINSLSSTLNEIALERLNNCADKYLEGVIQGSYSKGEITEEPLNTTISCNNITYPISYIKYTITMKHYKNASYDVPLQAWGAYTQGGGTQAEYNNASANWKRPQGKFFKNGKFYDACSITPSDCITVCDENGNQYKICADNVGNPKVEPV